MANDRVKREERAFELYLSNFNTSSEIMKKMGKAEKERFETIMKQLKQDTRFELTEVEYFALAKTMYFCEFVETELLINGVNECPQAVLKFYEQARKDVLEAMRRYRENKQVTNSSIEGLKKAMKEVLDEKGGMKATPRKDFVVIPRQPVETDTGYSGEQHDGDAVQHPQGDSGPADQTTE